MKKNKNNFFKKFRTKRVYFVKKRIFTSISQISRKLLTRFSWLFLVPLEELKLHLLEKKSKKKSIFFCQKISHVFFSMEFWKIFLFSLILMKIGSFIVQDKYICVIFEFSDFAQKWWKKIRFKFELRKILVQKHKQGEAFFQKKIT